MSTYLRQLFALLVLLTTATPALAQDISLAQRLGYPEGTKLLIVHADDIGVTHSVNRASFDALRSGAVNSGSIIVPGAWFPEAAALARQHPELDLGLHLALTSEWSTVRWDGVTSPHLAPSLHDSTGYLHASGEPMARVDAAEAEREIRAQVERALAFGIRPTHLDSHMGTLYATPELFGVFLRAAQEYNLPIFLPRYALGMTQQMGIRTLPPQVMVLDQVAIAPGGTAPDQLDEFYTGVIEKLEPGVTELIVHLSYDDAEGQAMASGQEAYGSAWRQADYDFVRSQAFRDLLARHNIRLITWREIGKLLDR